MPCACRLKIMAKTVVISCRCPEHCFLFRDEALSFILGQRKCRGLLILFVIKQFMEVIGLEDPKFCDYFDVISHTSHPFMLEKISTYFGRVILPNTSNYRLKFHQSSSPKQTSYMIDLTRR